MLTTKICVLCSKEKKKKKTLLSIKAGGKERQKSNLGGGCVPLCHLPGCSRRAWASGRHPAAPWHPSQWPPPRPCDPPLGPRLRPEVRKPRPALSPCWVGWEEVGGRAPRGGGSEGGRAQSPAARVRGGEKSAKGGPEPGGPRAPAIVAGAAPGSAGWNPIPPAARLLPAGPRGHAPTSARAPRRVGSGRPDSHKLPPARPPAPPRSLFAPRLLPPRRRRLRLPLWASGLSSSEPPAAEGAAAPGCACSGGARLLIPAGGGGAGAQAGLGVAGRGPSHQRWRGAEGRAEQAGWVGSGLRVAMAASTPGREPLAQGGAAQSGRRPRPRPAPQPSARSPAPALDPPPPRPASGK